MPLPGFSTLTLRGSNITGYHPEFNLYEFMGSPTTFPPGILRIILDENFYSDSQHPDIPGFSVGAWPAGTQLLLVNVGIIRGRAGKGGDGQVLGNPGGEVSGGGGGGQGTFSLPGAPFPDLVGAPGGGNSGTDPANSVGTAGSIGAAGVGGSFDAGQDPIAPAAVEEFVPLTNGSIAFFMDAPNVTVQIENSGLIEGGGAGGNGSGSNISSPANPPGLGANGLLITEDYGTPFITIVTNGLTGPAIAEGLPLDPPTFNLSFLSGELFPNVHGFTEYGNAPDVVQGP